MSSEDTEYIQELLQELSRQPSFIERKEIVQELGNLSVSHPKIVAVLAATRDGDEYEAVRRAAATALNSPVHQTVLQKNLRSIQELADGYKVRFQKARQRGILVGRVERAMRYVIIILFIILCLIVIRRLVSNDGGCSGGIVAGAPGDASNPCLQSQFYVGNGAP